MIKIAYILNIENVKIAWIVSGIVSNYKEMAIVLNKMSEEEIELFDNHFGF